MGFWFFMLIMTVLLPAVMIIFGKYSMKGGPKKINDLSGYRTTMSMKNQDTWVFAHKYVGRLWVRHGIIMLVASVLIMLLVINRGEDAASITGGVLVTIQTVWFILTIKPTEKALKANFNEDGTRK